MPPKVVLTSRKIKNEAVGIDVAVPSHDKVSSPKQVKNYHVIVITRLPHFKDATHSEDEVVQFTVPHDYESFEKLQKDMMEAFTDLKLPSLPRKFHLFMTDTDIEERQFAFDCLLKVLCKDKERCTSSIMLQFFGFDILAEKKYFKNRKEYLGRMKESKDKASAVDVEVSLFQSEAQTDSRDTLQLQKQYEATSLFDDEIGSQPPKRIANVSLLDTDLFHSTEQKTSVQSTDKLDADSEHSDLLCVSESLDDVLQAVNKAKKTSSVTTHGASHSTSSGRGLFDEDDEDVAASDMQTNEILKYIQQNTREDDDPDLF